ncbi:MAG: PEGA domain-containing protein, partial [Myxococcota bacterium]
GLVQLVRPYIARLVDGTKAEGYTGELEVLVSENEATVILGERELGLSPVTAVDGLPIGRHRVSVLKDGYVPFTQDVVIQRNELTLFQANLIDESSLVPWWQKWWVWTAVGGGLVAGGIVAAILLDDDEEGTLVIDQPFGGLP